MAIDIAQVIQSPGIKMVFVDAGMLEMSTRAFKQYSERNLSFTFGFDEHFEGTIEKIILR